MNPLLENILGQPRSMLQVIEHQSSLEGQKSLGAAAALMRRGNAAVLFTGMGSSLFASTAAVCYLNRHGFRAAAIDASELLYFGLAAVPPGSTIVLISRSGETVEILKLIAPLRDRGARLIAVTNVAASTLARSADVVILLGSAADHLVAIQSYTATCALLLMLAAQAAGENRQPEIEALPAELESVIRACLDSSEGWQDWLASAQCIYILGRGASLGSAREGALLFHEAARTPAIAMSVAQFRHGPVEVVDPRFRAVVFATQSATAELDRALASDLNAAGAEVRTVGPAASEDTRPLFPWQAGSLKDEFRTVIEIVAVQIAAFRKAEWCGIPAGEFRFAPLVTTEEQGFRLPATGRK